MADFGNLIEAASGSATPLQFVTKATLPAWLEKQDPRAQAWARTCGFDAAQAQPCLIPDVDGAPSCVLIGANGEDWFARMASLAERLPAGRYVLEDGLDFQNATRAALGWAVAAYRFSKYRARPTKTEPQLVWPEGCDRAYVENAVAAISLGRDLINTPASDMGPSELADAAQSVAQSFGADIRVIVGDDLLAENYPAVHAVGRASARPPRMIDLTWGQVAAPKVTIVGKGVCFDSGGLDLKSSSNMKLMKKDMGGAAHALALARMVLAAGLPVRLRLLIPAVENAVSGNAMRPLDVLSTRKGLTVEVGNTDAEGRLILADALAEADSEAPDILIDFATLTGAARAALGPELPALFTPDNALAEGLAAHGIAENDPMWRLPLWAPYRRMLDSKVADMISASDSPHAGAVTAALFLKEFVTQTPRWAHFDVFAWNPSGRPGRPEGGEIQTVRAVFALLAQRYAKS